jgi:tRNA threonylcarbamoyladenosine biosynthesis protein TsaE
MKWEINNIHDMDNVVGVALKKAREIECDEGVVIALHGDLGSGKTTFTKHLAKELGIDEIINSPTYVIQKEFDIENDESFKKLIHIDTYRIDLEDELRKLGWDENINDKGNIVAVEWPENIVDILPANTIHIYFNHVDENTRLIEIKDE